MFSTDIPDTTESCVWLGLGRKNTLRLLFYLKLNKHIVSVVSISVSHHSLSLTMINSRSTWTIKNESSWMLYCKIGYFAVVYFIYLSSQNICPGDNPDVLLCKCNMSLLRSSRSAVAFTLEPIFLPHCPSDDVLGYFMASESPTPGHGSMF